MCVGFEIKPSTEAPLYLIWNIIFLNFEPLYRLRHLDPWCRYIKNVWMYKMFSPAQQYLQQVLTENFSAKLCTLLSYYSIPTICIILS